MKRKYKGEMTNTNAVNTAMLRLSAIYFINRNVANMAKLDLRIDTIKSLVIQNITDSVCSGITSLISATTKVLSINIILVEK